MKNKLLQLGAAAALALASSAVLAQAPPTGVFSDGGFRCAR